MKRSITNKIRWAMDELVPACIRDSYLFMWPFFCLAYGTIRPARYMNFKSDVFKMSQKEYQDFYNGLNSISRKRTTDNNDRCIQQIVEDCQQTMSVLDVGCGRGHVLRKLRDVYPRIRLTGVDLLRDVSGVVYEYVHSGADHLPFDNNEFSVVCCTHMIEHVTDPESVVEELIRVARDKVIIVTPKQRPYYYTLDEHINFFFYRAQLERLVSKGHVATTILGGDWYMVITK